MGDAPEQSPTDESSTDESSTDESPTDESPTEEKPARRRPRWAKVLITIGVVIVVFATVVFAGSLLLAARYESKIDRADILKDVPRPAPPVGAPEGPQPLNYLLLGSDSRSPDPRPIADPNGDRSDTIMIVHINAARTDAFVFSIPRDSYVYVPAAGRWPGGYNKINAAMSYGGAAHAALTVYELTKIPLDGAFVMNFSAVNRMVAVVGSIEVCLPYTVNSFHRPGTTWAQGCHEMDADDVEIFVRERHGVPGGDFGRIRNQQLVVQALAKKIASAGLLTNPLQLDRLISIAAESVTVDQDTDLRQLILDLKDIDPGRIAFATTPWTRTMTTDAGSSVELDMAAAQDLFEAVRTDQTAQWLATHPQDVP